MIPIYRFFLQFNKDGEKFPVFPIYGNGLSLEYSRETNQRYYRARLSDKLVFNNEDYERIMGADFETEYILTVEKQNNAFLPFDRYCVGHFFRTDCTINEEEKTVRVQPDTYDEYNTITSAMEKETDILKQPLQTESVIVRKRPLLQIYVPGDNVVSCYVGGTNYEQEVQNVVANITDLKNTYHFAFASFVAEVDILPFSLIPDLQGIYAGKPELKEISGNFEGFLNRYPGNKDYRVFISRSETINYGGKVEISRRDTGEVMYRYEGFLEPGTVEISLEATPNYIGNVTARVTNLFIYARYLLDVQKLNGKNTNVIPSEDIVANNKNYQRVIGYGVDVCTISNRWSDVPQRWGKNPEGKYYLPPFGALAEYYPLARSKWGNASLWFFFPAEGEALEMKARKEYVIRDCYPISSVISVLLKRFCPDIKHEATPEYSEFLYANTNPIYGDKFTLLVTPKTNVLTAEYTTPAQKAKTTLRQVLDMLKNCFQLYWFVENGKLKIEHIKWFKNGGSYTGTQAVGYDLTKAICTRNGKPWSFKTSEYTYDVEKMPQRYQFDWMDEVSDAFEGLPIEIVSRFVEAGKVEDVNISGFTSDFDFMVMNPERISNDGFALFAAVDKGAGYELPFIRVTLGGREFELQNGLISMPYLQKAFWKYDLPAFNVIINGESVRAESIARNKTQTVTIPAGVDDPDLVKLVKTEIGNGEIEKISINLQTRAAKTTLKYETQ